MGAFTKLLDNYTTGVLCQLGDTDFNCEECPYLEIRDCWTAFENDKKKIYRIMEALDNFEYKAKEQSNAGQARQEGSA